MRFSSVVLLAAMALPSLCSAQSDPVAVIDTTMGRMQCHLFQAQKPGTVAAFTAMANGGFDGAQIRWQNAGIVLPMRPGQVAAGSFPADTTSNLKLDRPGLMAMLAADANGGTRVGIYDHARANGDSGKVSVFGECNAASVAMVTRIGHTLASVDNDPSLAAVTVTNIVIVHKGDAMPPLPKLPAPPKLPKPVLKGPEPQGRTVTFETSMGNISCRLFEKESPVAVSTFLGLVDGSKEWTDPTTHQVQHNHRFYDGLEIERVIPDFVIQTGDITNDPSGNTDIGFRFKNERTPGLTYDRPGRLAFGNGGVDTNNSEIFISEHPIHRLDSGFTIFGQCDDAGVKVVQAIARVPRDGKDRPLTKVILKRVTVSSK